MNNEEWLVWHPDQKTETEAQIIFAVSSQESAEVWGETVDYISKKYSIANGNSVVVKVRHVKTRALYKFRVSGKIPEPVYMAEEIVET